ncbi:MAG TPA: hypothetical protein VMI92_07160 [Steroidobacteraceae bacterium]|nr:hypothetical protein [Steroidobacteraceae bacterium]
MSRILIMTALLAAATAAWSADGTDIEPGVATSPAAAAAPAPAPAQSSPSPGAAPAAAPASDSGAAAAATGDSTRGLDEQIQGLKSDVIDLNTELFSLEEELLYPANTQVAIFVSMDVGEFFALDSVTVKIDDKEVSNYLYTPREVNALLQGGVQRMYVGNLKAGQHELVAFFTGKGPNDRDYKRGATIKFEKSIGAKYLELKITDRASKLQPEFAIRDWE